MCQGEAASACGLSGDLLASRPEAHEQCQRCLDFRWQELHAVTQEMGAVVQASPKPWVSPENHGEGGVSSLSQGGFGECAWVVLCSTGLTGLPPKKRHLHAASKKEHRGFHPL